MAKQVTFGKFSLVRRLAVGGMAEIFLARQEGMAGFARDVVIKCVHKQFGNDQEFVTMFLDEARLAARLSHPNIVMVHEFGQEDRTYYLVMEYVDGKSVAEITHRTGRLPPAQALRIVSEVCQGLSYAHSLCDDSGQGLGLVHRDVSPANVLVAFDGSVKIIDFGVAKAATHIHKTRAGAFKGKYAYMAPEQAYGHGADYLSDLHSVGILLWEMLTGKQLFQRDTVFQTMDAVLNLVAPSVGEYCPDLVPTLDQIIRRCLAKNPTDRYGDCGELQAAVDELAAEKGFPLSSFSLSRYVEEAFKQERSPEQEPREAAEARGPANPQEPAWSKQQTDPDGVPLPRFPGASGSVGTAPVHIDDEVTDRDVRLSSENLSQPEQAAEFPPWAVTSPGGSPAEVEANSSANRRKRKFEERFPPSLWRQLNASPARRQSWIFAGAAIAGLAVGCLALLLLAWLRGGSP